jgi:hypothetical protein
MRRSFSGRRTDESRAAMQEMGIQPDYFTEIAPDPLEAIPRAQPPPQPTVSDPTMGTSGRGTSGNAALQRVPNILPRSSIDNTNQQEISMGARSKLL